MKVVISDASCLILFTNINRLALLEQLFGEILITSAVADEYRLALPAWISIHEPLDRGRIDALSLSLDLGEATSLALALENPGCRIIVDEKKGRRVAKALGLDVIGTLGVLLEASEKELVAVDQELIDLLDKVSFRLSAHLKKRLLEAK